MKSHFFLYFLIKRNAQPPCAAVFLHLYFYPSPLKPPLAA